MIYDTCYYVASGLFIDVIGKSAAASEVKEPTSDSSIDKVCFGENICLLGWLLDASNKFLKSSKDTTPSPSTSAA